MKTEYLKAVDVAKEIRCSQSKARTIMRDEMTCLAIGTGVYRTRVVTRVEFERWKERQIEPPLAPRTIIQKRAKRGGNTFDELPPDIPRNSRGWPLPRNGIDWQRAMDERKKLEKQARKESST